MKDECNAGQALVDGSARWCWPCIRFGEPSVTAVKAHAAKTLDLPSVIAKLAVSAFPLLILSSAEISLALWVGSK